MNFLTVIALCKNERTLCPFFVRHYNPIADHIIVYDNQSTDGSQEYLRNHGCEVREFDTRGMLRDARMSEIQSEAYKQEKSEWFIACAFDEFIHHHTKCVRDYLADCKTRNLLVPGTQGFQMIGTSVPKDTGFNRLTHEIKTGCLLHAYSKQAVFHHTVDIRFDPGSHCARPVTRGFNQTPIPLNQHPELLLLHYKWLSREEGLRKHRLMVETVARENPNYAKRLELIVDSGEAEYDQWLSQIFQVLK